MTRTVAVSPRKTFETPGSSRVERLVDERVFEARPCGSGRGRRARSESRPPGVPASRRSPRTTRRPRRRRAPSARGSRSARGRGGGASEEVVEAAGRARDDEHPAGAEGDGLVERELEVGRVLGAGWPRTRTPSRSSRASVSAPIESRSPITTSISSPSSSARSAPPSAASTVAPRGTSTTGPRPAATTTTSGSCTRSSAGITQVRFCGSAARSRPLSPDARSSPIRSRTCTARAGTGDSGAGRYGQAASGTATSSTRASRCVRRRSATSGSRRWSLLVERVLRACDRQLPSRTRAPAIPRMRRRSCWAQRAPYWPVVAPATAAVFLRGRAPAGRPRGPVDRVLQDAGDRAVVLRRHDEQRVGWRIRSRRSRTPAPLARHVEVGVVERDVAQPVEDLDVDARGRQLGRGAGHGRG